MTTTSTTPTNSAALSAALRAHGEVASSMALRLVCDMLADMPEDLACAYAERVRALDTTVAHEVADMLDAYREAWNAEPPLAAEYQEHDVRCDYEASR